MHQQPFLSTTIICWMTMSHPLWTYIRDVGIALIGYHVLYSKDLGTVALSSIQLRSAPLSSGAIHLCIG
jgi:hypothetical protein